MPLRLDDLGASGTAIGAIFLVAAAVEAVVSPVAGRLSDRRGRLAPIRVGLAGAAVMAVLLPLPDTAVLLAAALVLVVAALGSFWAPAMALLSDASEEAGLDQALAFSIANLAWALGHVLGGGGGGALADATADALVYGLLGVRVRDARSSPARSPWGGRARACSRPPGQGSSARAVPGAAVQLQRHPVLLGLRGASAGSPSPPRAPGLEAELVLAAVGPPGETARGLPPDSHSAIWRRMRGSFTPVDRPAPPSCARTARGRARRASRGRRRRPPRAPCAAGSA